MKIIVPLIPPSANVLKRKYRNPHAYARLRELWEHNIWALLPLHHRAAVGDGATYARARVIITVRHSREYDPDNLHASVKPVLDSLVRLGIIAGDSPKEIELTVKQQKCKRRDGETFIEIQGIA